MADRMTPANEAAAFWGLAENEAYPLEQRLECALKALQFFGWKFDKEELEADVTPVNVDVVNHPPHYTAHPSGVECIQVVEHMGFNLGNAVKYIWRADLKGNAIQDLEKADWYVQREIKRRSQ